MIKAIIVDDELNNREKLLNLLLKNCPTIKVVGEANGVRSGISKIREKNPDLIFLDIRMGDGTGFDLLKRFDTIDFKVIFVTAFEEFALKAFRFSAIDYLLKPVDPLELKDAVEKVSQQLTHEHQQRLNNLASSIQSGRLNKIALKDAENIHLVNIDDIIHCLADGNYIRFVLSNQSDILISKNLKEFEELLAGSGFLRVHKSHLINLPHAKRFEKANGGFVVMSNDDRVPVASRKKEQLLDIFKRM
jgi:two-component system LytT family response regulator